MSKVARLKKLSEWQETLEAFNKQKLTEPLFITTDLTREDADILLELNDHNRSLLERVVRRYESFMDNDKWVINGECIKVAPDGTLLDGQHRMEALRRHAKPVRMSMALGVHKDTFSVNDTGKSRNSGDILSMAGYKNVTQNSAALRYLMWYQQSESFSSYPDISPSDTLTAIKRWPHLTYFVPSSHPFRIFGPQSVFQFFMYITQTIDPEQSYLFFEKLETGEKLGKTSAILQLRTLLLKARVNNMAIDKRHMVACLIITWNSFIEKTRIKSVKWDGKGFPMITGINRKKLFKQGSGFSETT